MGENELLLLITDYQAGESMAAADLTRLIDLLIDDREARMLADIRASQTDERVVIGRMRAVVDAARVFMEFEVPTHDSESRLFDALAKLDEVTKCPA